MDKPGSSRTTFVVFFFFFAIFSSNFLQIFSLTNTISVDKSLSDGQTLTSDGGAFQLGFFTPDGAPPSYRYVGVWYKRPGDRVVIWVANRKAHVDGNNGVLTLSNDGALVLAKNSSNVVIWSTPTTWSVSSGDIRALLDNSGNLVLQQQPGNRTLWKSFDDPSNTLVPASSIYVDPKSNKERHLVSWKSNSDPSTGTFSHYLRVGSFVQGVTYNGSRIHFRSGPWVGTRFAGVPGMRSAYASGFVLNRDNNRISFQYAPSLDTKELRLVLGFDGKLHSWRWEERRKEWLAEWSAPHGECDLYATCGEFAVCKPSSSIRCHCPRGFRVKGEEEKGGCVREKELGCTRNRSGEKVFDGFLKLERMKLPDFAEGVSYMVNWSRERCEDTCLRNCSCLAYAYVEDNCMIWAKGLVDMVEFSSGGEDLYLKLEASQLDHPKNREKTITVVVVVVVLVLAILVFVFGLLVYFFRKKSAKEQSDDETGEEVRVRASMTTPILEARVPPSVYDAEILDFTFFSFDAIVAATRNFSGENKLGEGGFGSVYKGVLQGGVEIAVKRMPGDLGQGLESFKNEVMLISKLQHRNLVRLLGCCFNEEKLLVYEFMPNKSLDAFLFEPRQDIFLDWSKRFHVIVGVAQGLLYLHRDSRLKIIHRDLKASNILLDGDLNAKIADFGTARIFYGDQILARTRRVVGTYGYMSPEYAMHGQFSEKSDVFSFGVLVLEIVGGKRIGSFYQEEYSLNLIGYAWRLWNEKNVSQFVDPQVSRSWPESNAMKCILVALLCVQELAVDRPTSSQVVSMLTSGDMDDLHDPKMPSFIGRRDLLQSNSSENSGSQFSVNHVTLTSLQGR